MNQIEFFRLQKEILEKFFPLNWFTETSEKNHPAFLRWMLCNKILQQRGVIKFPDQETELLEIGRLVLDSAILVTLTQGNLSQLKFGSLDLYGDKAVQKKIRSRITNPEQFEDIMVELSFGAWHEMVKHSVIPLEIESYPDLELKIVGIDIPIFVECKHLRSASENRLNKEITKANSQIKATGIPCYGIGFFDVSIPVSMGQVEDDEFPMRLQEIIEIVQSTISGPKNRSIGVVLLAWDDYNIMGEPPDLTQITFRRRHVRIPHSPSKDVMEIPEDLRLFDGYTTIYNLHWKPRG